MADASSRKRKVRVAGEPCGSDRPLKRRGGVGGERPARPPLNVDLALPHPPPPPPPQKKHPAQVAYFYDPEVSDYYYGGSHPMK